MGNFCCRSKEAKLRAAVEGLVHESLVNSAHGSGEWSNQDEHKNLDSLQAAFQKNGLESCSLIVGIDFTRSNLSQGKNSFHGESLHALDTPHGPNPYEVAMQVIGEALRPFDEDGLLPTFLFGDAETKHRSVRQIGEKKGCKGIDGVLQAYRQALRDASFSGPTSFAPLIDKAVSLVKESGNAMHTLLILADGQVSPVQDCDVATRDAIVRAAGVPLSIVTIGLGDGPWADMVDFDNGLPQRDFDNFQFVEFTKFYELLSSGVKGDTLEVARAAFAVCALQELPEQFKYCARKKLLGASSEL